MPIRHELLAHKEIPLHKLGEHPLILCDPQVCEGYCRELTRLLRPLEREPNIVEHASSLNMMLTLVGAGWVNDEQTLRSSGSKSDPYAVFEKMLGRGNPPDEWNALVQASKQDWSKLE